MSDVAKISISGTAYNIKDITATNSLSKATTNETNVKLLSQESLTVEYSNETISFATGIAL